MRVGRAWQGNYEFGISRIMKSLEPYDKKLGTDTWYYTKRCFLGLALTMAKSMVTLKVCCLCRADGMSVAAPLTRTSVPRVSQDSTLYEILNFFDSADQYGKNIVTVVKPGAGEEEKRSVSYEARLLKRMFLLLKDK